MSQVDQGSPNARKAGRYLYIANSGFPLRLGFGAALFFVCKRAFFCRGRQQLSPNPPCLSLILEA